MKDKKQTMGDCLQQAKLFYKDVIDEDEASVELNKKTFNEARNILAEKEEQLIVQVQAQSMLKGENLDKFSKAVHAVTQTANYVESVVKENCDDLEMISDMSKQMDKVFQEYYLDEPLSYTQFPVGLHYSSENSFFCRAPNVIRFSVNHRLPRMLRKQYMKSSRQKPNSLAFHMDLQHRHLHPQYLDIIKQQFNAFTL
uniref:Uncharacterized protein n=1 Tax=Clytia hemisphaerica TaxID=252671 RepID=A0A7M6DR86_9CNID